LVVLGSFRQFWADFAALVVHGSMSKLHLKSLKLITFEQ
jgi:hypothetical protein